MAAHDSRQSVPMTLGDHAWLRMDEPENLVIIHATLIFDEPLALADVAPWLGELFTPHHQFTHRVQRSWLRARFEPDPAFSLSRHLQEAHLPPGSGTHDLQAWIAEGASQPLPVDRALWQATLVHGVDGSSALVLRIHHCLIDGRALTALLSDRTPIAAGATPMPRARVSQREGLSLGYLLRRLPRTVADGLHILLMRPDKPTRLKGRPGLDKAMAWSAPLPLPQLRELAQSCGATVNDAMLAVISDALCSYLRAKGESPDSMLRAVVPMDLREPGRELELGNCFGLVGVDLPVHSGAARQRLMDLRDATRVIKRSTQSHLGLGILRFAGTLPRLAQQAIFRLFTGRCSAVVTNVIGPPETRSVAGRRIRDLLVFVPQSLSIGLGISIVSYADSVRVGFLSDRGLMPDPELAAEAILPGFEQLALALRQVQPAPADPAEALAPDSLPQFQS